MIWPRLPVASVPAANDSVLSLQRRCKAQLQGAEFIPTSGAGSGRAARLLIRGRCFYAVAMQPAL